MSLKSLYHKYAPAFVKDLRRDLKIKKQNRDTGRYQEWIRTHEKEGVVPEMAEGPLISVIVPVYDVKTEHLRACLDSVLEQTYPHFELCIAEDHAKKEEVREVLRGYEADPHVKIVYREQNGHISAATNSALALAEGEYAAFLDCDDLLSRDALSQVARMLVENPDLDFVYSDEDKLSEKGLRYEPFFKPEYSPDTLMSVMYTSHLGVYRRSILSAIGGFRVGYEGAQDYDMTLRFVEQTDSSRIGHIPRVLYHWRAGKGSTAADTEAKDYIAQANKRITEEAMQRQGRPGYTEYIDILRQYRPVYDPQGAAVSIIIPSKDNAGVWERCVRSICECDTGIVYELITVDNGSGEAQKAQYEKVCAELGIRYIYEPAPFHFSAMCNRGAQEARYPLLLFLNDDTRLLQADSFARMAGQARLPHAGAVGAKLLYPDGKHIQHIGVINIAPGPSHAFLSQRDDAPLRQARNIADFNYCAVTGACLMIEKNKFLSVGGFDESFPIGYNDIALCFSLMEQGYYNVVRTDARLIHYESLSRGDDRIDPAKYERLQRELERLYEKHPRWRGYDPYYSANMDQYNVNFTV